jgi:hypothetical protein
MISINLSSIEELASAILRQIHPRVSNFDRNHAVAPIRNRYILAAATPRPGRYPAYQPWNWVPALRQISIGRLKQFCRIATSREQETSIDRMKPAALTLNVSVQCSKNSGKLGWV